MCSSSKGIWSVVNSARGKDVDHSINNTVTLFTDLLSAVESTEAHIKALLLVICKGRKIIKLNLVIGSLTGLYVDIGGH